MELRVSTFWFLFIIIATALFVLTLGCAVLVWVFRRRFTKERFAFAALSSIAFLTLSLVGLVGGRDTPWSIIQQLLGWISHNENTIREPNNVDYIFLLAIYGLYIYSVLNLFRNWSGQRSVRQHEKEQRRQDMSLVAEGFMEFVRVIKRVDSAPIYQGPTARNVSLLPAPIAPGPWHLRARDLVRIKWSYYDFPIDTGWHQNAKCWVGKNANTQDIVLLRCAVNDLKSNELQSFVGYSARIAGSDGVKRVELVVAIENSRSQRFDSDDIPTPGGSAIRVETESSLLDGLIDWSDYQSDIRKRMSVLPLPDSELTVSDVFVRPHISQDDWPSGENMLLEGYLERWLDEPGQRQLALLGDYGQGKSTAALAFVHRHLIDVESGRVPILIELRGMSPRNMDALELLGAWGSNYNISAKALWNMHLSGRLVLVFEGFDEMALVGDVDARLRHFATLWEFCSDQAKILITGRPNLFFDNRELTTALGTERTTSGVPYCTVMRLMPFGLSDVREALRNHDRNVREEICAFAERDQQFRELIARPSLLYIVAVLWGEEDFSERMNVLTSASVMECFVRNSFRRQGLKAGESRDFMALNSEERKYFMKGIASYMATHGAQNQISGRELNDLVVSLVDAIPEDVSGRPSAITGEEKEPLESRVRGLDYLMEHVQNDVRTCGILVEDPVAVGAFRFGHKSFMEYLFAQVVAETIADEYALDAVSILKACDAHAGKILDLPASVVFLAEILAVNRSGSGGEGDQMRQAKRLFRLLVVGEGRVYYALRRYWLYRASLNKLSVRVPSYLRPFALLMDPALVLVIVVVAGSAGLKRDAEVAYYLGYLVGGWTMGVIAGLFSGRFGQVKSTSRLGSLAVWNALCVGLGFESAVLWKMSGVGWWPGIGAQPFDLFLPHRRKSKSEEGNGSDNEKDVDNSGSGVVSE